MNYKTRSYHTMHGGAAQALQKSSNNARPNHWGDTHYPLVIMSADEANSLIFKIRSSERILVVVGAGLSRPSGIPTFRDDAWFWERPIEDSASETAFKRDPLYVWAVYERLRLIAVDASPNPAHAALARLAGAKPKLLTVSQNIDGT